MKRMYIYCMIDEATNSYDYEDEASTTDQLEEAYRWIEDGKTYGYFDKIGVIK